MDVTSVITNVIVVAGFILTGLYQKKKIDALQQNISTLKNVVSAQQTLVGDMHKAANIINVERWIKQIKAIEELIEKNKQEELKAYQRDLQEEHNRTREEQRTFFTSRIDDLMNRYGELVGLVINTMVYVNPDKREQLVLDNMETSGLRERFLKSLERIKDFWIHPTQLEPQNALLTNQSEEYYLSRMMRKASSQDNQ